MPGSILPGPIEGAAPGRECLPPAGGEAPPFAPGPVRGWLASGDVDRAMHFLSTFRARDRLRGAVPRVPGVPGRGADAAALEAPGGAGPADADVVRREWTELLGLLEQNPFIAWSRARPHGYAGDPGLLDLALGLAPVGAEVSPLGRRCYEWLLEHARICAALRRRTGYLGGCIDRAAERLPHAPVAAPFAGHLRELQASEAFTSGRVRACAVDHDARALAAAAAAALPQRLGTVPATLGEVLAGEARLQGCGLVYLPTLAEHLPDRTLAALLAALAGWLAPRGELVVASFTELPEAGFLAEFADWRPNVRGAAALLRLADGVPEVDASVRTEPAFGLAFLHLARR